MKSITYHINHSTNRGPQGPKKADGHAAQGRIDTGFFRFESTLFETDLLITNKYPVSRSHRDF